MLLTGVSAGGTSVVLVPTLQTYSVFTLLGPMGFSEDGNRIVEVASGGSLTVET